MTPILARPSVGPRLRECTVMSPSQPPTTSPGESTDEDPGPSPKDRFVTVYGRKPVLEALSDPALQVDKVVLAEGADPRAVRPLLEAARTRGIPVRRASAQRGKGLAGDGRPDQGVIADVVAPGVGAPGRVGG